MRVNDIHICGGAGCDEASGRVRLAGRAPGDWMGREVAAELQMEGERVQCSESQKQGMCITLPVPPAPRMVPGAEQKLRTSARLNRSIRHLFW